MQGNDIDLIVRIAPYLLVHEVDRTTPRRMMLEEGGQSKGTKTLRGETTSRLGTAEEVSPSRGRAVPGGKGWTRQEVAIRTLP